MKDSTTQLRIKSYNSTGCNDDRLSYLNASSECDIILVQEHWLLANNLHRIKTGVNGFTGIANSGVDETQIVLTGRPYGGCAILWRHELTPLITPVQVESLSRRVCSATLNLTKCKILILSVYFPTDPGTVVYNKADLDIMLSDIMDVFLNVHCDAIILGGDLNSDFARNTGFVSQVKAFMHGLNLSSLWNKYPVDFTYLHTDGMSTSTIDHFMVSNNLLGECLSGGVTHDIDNTSNHSIIYMNVDISMSIDTQYASEMNIIQAKPAWYKAGTEDIRNFKANVNSLLGNVDLSKAVFDCDNMLCERTGHQSEIDDYFDSLMQVLIDSGTHIPHTCAPNKSTRIPGWNDFVKPYRQDALFWKWMHDQLGKPGVGWVAQIMRRTRAKYHYALRHVRSEKEKLKRLKLLSSMFSSDRNFFKEVKRLRGHDRNNCQIIDGLSDNSQIAEKFAQKYKELYSSNSSDPSELKSMMETLYSQISNTNSKAECTITMEHILKAIGRLKSDKQDGVFAMLASEHFINATDDFYKHLCVLFSKCLIHGYMPSAMTLSTLIPIPKDNNDMKSSDKYRGIALSALCNKLFEYVILDLYGHLLISGELQFAYKHNASTTQCTWVAREVISYYNNNGSDVYSCLLDCSKAFDRIRHDKLLYKLIQTGLPAVITRSLMGMYVNSQLRVKWRDKLSASFDATNGVKQGSVLSPILFTLCLDDLILELEKRGDGCWIGHKYYGIVGFADDLKLLCPSLKGLQKMLNVCHKFSVSTGLIFNSDKTVCIKFHASSHINDIVQYPMFLGENQLKWCTKVKHLGHVFNCCLSFTPDVAYRKGQFIGCVNGIITQFGFAHPVCKLKLLTTHGYSFYGSSLWNLYGNACSQLYVTWNIAIRRLYDLPRMAHTRFLTHITGIPHINHSLKCRFVKFVHKAITSCNSKVSFLANMCLSNTQSITGNNMSNILLEYGLNLNVIENLQFSSKMNVSYYGRNCLPNEQWKCDMILELLNCMYGLSQCGLSYQQTKECLHYIAES